MSTGTADEPASNDGIFATIWNQHGGRWTFRVGLCALFASMVLGSVVRFGNWGQSSTASLVIGVLSLVTGILALVLLGHCLRKYGGLKSARVPRTEGEPAATKVRFRTPGIGPFGGGSGEIRLPAGLVRVVNWRPEPWDVVVMIALWIILWNVGPLGCIGALILVPATGLPRRRPIVEDLRIDDVKRIEVGHDHVVVETRSGEPFRQVVCSMAWTHRAALVERLRAHCPDVLVIVEKPKRPRPQKPKPAPGAADLDASLARVRALRDSAES